MVPLDVLDNIVVTKENCFMVMEFYMIFALTKLIKYHDLLSI